ncbi:MAG: DUF4367 domain-containing protein [Candidatus Nomurabacteria bacterium]|jgi:hypothetical protein|nr:DUF4367 domain-containing protein [Candidatus Nomurabacteria bacterium]
MSLPGSKLSAIKIASQKTVTVSRATTPSITPVTVLDKPVRIIKHQPKLLTLADPNVITVKKTKVAPEPKPTPSPLAKAVKEPVENSEKEPVENFSPNPADNTTDTPVENSEIPPVDNSKITPVQSPVNEPLKKYAIARRKVWAGLAFAGFALLVTGFLVYLNLPDISVRVRATELGISVNLPAYKPAGYSINGVAKVEDNTLITEYTKNDDSYTFTARKSTFDSHQVADYAKSIFADPESIFSNGLTIYVQGHDAIWANGGILYSLTDSSQITQDDILKIAISTE